MPERAGPQILRLAKVLPTCAGGTGLGQRRMAIARAMWIPVPCSAEQFVAAKHILAFPGRPQAARMFDRKASISARRTSASRRSAPDAVSTSPAADPAWDEAALTPMILLETSLVPPAAC